jgi:hypothetical protein
MLLREENMQPDHEQKLEVKTLKTNHYKKNTYNNPRIAPYSVLEIINL